MEWIDVNLELPIETIHTGYGITSYKASNKLQINYIQHNINFVTIGYLCDGKWYDTLNRRIDFVTHWAELLKPLKIKIMQNNIENRKTVKTTKTELITLLKNNIGKLLTIVFIKEDGTVRTVNGQFNNHLSVLGYYQFKTSQKEHKQFDAKNLLEVRVNKTIYKLK